MSLFLRTGTFALSLRTSSKASQKVPFSLLRPNPNHFRSSSVCNNTNTVTSRRNTALSYQGTERNNEWFHTTKRKTKGLAIASERRNFGGEGSENDVIRSIQNCERSFDLGDIIRAANYTIFASNYASKALAEKIKELAPTMRGRDESGLLNCLSKVNVPNHTKNLQYGLMTFLADISMNNINNCKARDMSMIVNALAKKEIAHEKLFNTIAAKSIPIIGTFNAQGLANIANAYAKMNQYHPQFFDEIATASISNIGTFNSQNLANTANAFAKMNYDHPRLFDEIATASIHIISTFNAQELANIAHAYAKMNRHHQLLFDKIATASIHIIRTFNAQELANIANAYTKMNFHHQRLFDEIAPALVSIISTFNSQDLANTANAYAKMNQNHPRLFHEIAKVSILIIHTFNAQELANTMNAFARVGQYHPRLFDAFATAAIPIINTFKAQELANISNAYAKVNHRHPRLFDEIAKVSIPMISTSFNAQDLANVANAYARFNHENLRLFHEIATASITNISTFKAQELSNTVNAYAKMNYNNPRLFHKIATALLPIISTCNAQELANAVNAYARMNQHPPQLFDEIATALIPFISTCNSQTLSNAVSAFGIARLTGNEKVRLLLSSVSKRMATMDSLGCSNWPNRDLAEVAYTFMKLSYTDKKLLDSIGKAIISNSEDEFELDARGLGNLAASFTYHLVPCSTEILKLVYDKFCTMEQDQIELQSVADISGSMQIAQQLNVVTPKMLETILNLAIKKVSESRAADVRDVILGLCNADITEAPKKKLLRAYSPYVKRYFEDLSVHNQYKIRSIYVQSFEINSNDSSDGNTHENDSEAKIDDSNHSKEEEDILSSMKVVELKKLCRKHELKVSGKKAVLIERLREYLRLEPKKMSKI